MSNFEKKVFDELLAISRFLGLDLRDFELRETKLISGHSRITGICKLNGKKVVLPDVDDNNNVRKILTQSLLNLLS